METKKSFQINKSPPPLPSLFIPKYLKMYVNLHHQQYCVAMIQICIFPNCKGDASDYDVNKTENLTLGVAPPQGLG